MSLMCIFSYLSGGFWSQDSGSGMDIEETCKKVGGGRIASAAQATKICHNAGPNITDTWNIWYTKQRGQNRADGRGEGDGQEGDSASGEFIKTLIMVKLETHHCQFKCPSCDVTLKATRLAMDAHIRSEHTKEALECHLSIHYLQS